MEARKEGRAPAYFDAAEAADAAAEADAEAEAFLAFFGAEAAAEADADAGAEAAIDAEAEAEAAGAAAKADAANREAVRAAMIFNMADSFSVDETFYDSDESASLTLGEIAQLTGGSANRATISFAAHQVGHQDIMPGCSGASAASA